MPVRLPARLSEPVLRAMKRPMNAARSEDALRVLELPVTYGDFDNLSGSHILLVTYKRDGTPIPSPVWFARDGEQLYVWTEINAFKAKRLRNDERARAAKTIRSSWGPGRRIFEAVSRPLTDVHYLAFVPAPAP